MPMISREALRELAIFESSDHAAVSFYYQPATPQDQSHRGEAILIKDLVRDALRSAGPRHRSRPDLERLLALAERLNGNHSRAKAVFACEAQKLWREFDLPPRLSRSRVMINRRFCLRPLVTLLDAWPRTCVAVSDRRRARVFDVWNDTVQEVADLLGDLPRAGRTAGFSGYDERHNERHLDTHALWHFKRISERLMERHDGGLGFECLALGCRDDVFAEIEPYLHPYLKQALIGRFNADVVTVTPEEVRQKTQALLEQHRASRRQALLREVLGQAQRDGRGALGLRRVLESLERGEVQTLLLSEDFAAHAVECANCRHLDSRITPECAVCGRPVREVEDVAEVIIARALRNHADFALISAEGDFSRAGSIGALLRFRADQSTAEKLRAG